MLQFKSEFDAFWDEYPHRVGKLAAIRAYVKARRIANPEDILAGVRRYVRSKPDWQTWAHPSTWLNAGRWLDEGPQVKTYEPWICPHEPRCPHRIACAVVSARPERTT